MKDFVAAVTDLVAAVRVGLRGVTADAERCAHVVPVEHVEDSGDAYAPNSPPDRDVGPVCPIASYIEMASKSRVRQQVRPGATRPAGSYSAQAPSDSDCSALRNQRASLA